MKHVKRYRLLLLSILCMQLLVGCGNKTAQNNTGDMASNATNKPAVTATPEVPDSEAQENLEKDTLSQNDAQGNDGVVNDMGDAVEDMVDGAGDVVKDVTDGAGDVVKDATTGVSDAVDDVTDNK